MLERLDSDDIEYFENYTGLELDVSAQNDSEAEEPMCNFQVLRVGLISDVKEEIFKFK